jgi:hypothetical protein
MTAKEKAFELVDTYKFVLWSEDTQCGEEILCTGIAKRCALIAVDEMIDIRNGLYINEGSIAHQWLLDVKHEIEKL